jgi:hypothetical protein
LLNNNNTSSLDETNKENDHPIIQRRDIRSVILILDDVVEYNRVKELGDLVMYRSKLISYYGFDIKTGKWNTSQSPVIQTDAQMEGIKSDIERYNRAVADYKNYAEYLAKKYRIDINDQIQKGRSVMFRPPLSTPAYMWNE